MQKAYAKGIRQKSNGKWQMAMAPLPWVPGGEMTSGVTSRLLEASARVLKFRAPPLPKRVLRPQATALKVTDARSQAISVGIFGAPTAFLKCDLKASQSLLSCPQNS